MASFLFQCRGAQCKSLAAYEDEETGSQRMHLAQLKNDFKSLKTGPLPKPGFCAKKIT